MAVSETELGVARAPALNDAAKPKTVFDRRDIEPAATLKDAIAYLLFKNGRFLRFFFPIVNLGGLIVVTRFDDVQEVLRRDDFFPTGLLEKHKLITGGQDFLLGMDDGPQYRRVLSQLMKAFRREDADGIGEFSARVSREIVGSAPGRLDVIQDLLTRVPTLICEKYYGVTLNEENRVPFSHWTFAISQYLFVDAGDNPLWRRAAEAASERLREVLEASVAQVRSAIRAGRPVPDTIISRLIHLQRSDSGALSDDELRASMMGMIAGFIPTNTIAAGNLIRLMLGREDLKEAAQRAARGGDDEKLTRVIFEISRLASGIGAGRFRTCAKETVLAAGTPREKLIRKGDKLLAGTVSAMFDGRRIKDPLTFNPDRDPNDYLLFGYGLHACLGLFIAKAQITQTLKPLLMKNGLRAARGEAGQLTRFGTFPQHLIVEFEK